MANGMAAASAHASIAEFEWAEDAEHALVCCVRHVLELVSVSVSTDEGFVLHMYKHGQWPCLYVDVVATVVGAQLRSSYAEYALDDGSGVVDVFCRGHVAIWTADWHDAGVDACYVRPVPTLVHDTLHFALGDTVRVRAQVHERDDKLRVLRAVAMGACDVNDEARHTMEALNLARVYRKEKPPCEASPGELMPPPSPPCADSDVPSPFKSHSRRAFTYYVWMYMNAATEHALERATELDVHSVPAFSIATLATNLAHRAGAVVQRRRRDKHTNVSHEALVHRLLHGALSSLVRLGRVVQSGAMYQVAHPRLVAWHVAKVLRLLRTEPRQTIPPARALRTTSVRYRLQQHHERFSHISLAGVNAAMHVLASYGLVHGVDGSTWSIDTPTSTH